MTSSVTLLELVTAVSDFAGSDAEAVACVVHLVNSGAVRLRGNLAGARIDLRRGGDDERGAVAH